MEMAVSNWGSEVKIADDISLHNVSYSSDTLYMQKMKMAK
jgi:hypothetical protein